jgi:predicted RNA-binding protein YlqC (UPF0109 family)
VSDGYDADLGGDDEYDDEEDSGNRVPAGVATAVLDYLARAIVDDPESVVVEVDEGRHGVTLRLHVAPDDMGKVIGRRGRVAQAIRALVRAAGARDGSDVQVDIVD